MADLSQKLQEQVLQARKTGQKLNIEGGGTKAFMGRAADADAKADRDQPDRHGITRADHQHGKDVPAEMIRAERMGDGGRVEFFRDIQHGDRIGRPDQRQRGYEQDGKGYRTADHEAGMAGRTAPETGPVTAWSDECGLRHCRQPV